MTTLVCQLRNARGVRSAQCRAVQDRPTWGYRDVMCELGFRLFRSSSAGLSRSMSSHAHRGRKFRVLFSFRSPLEVLSPRSGKRLVGPQSVCLDSAQSHVRRCSIWCIHNVSMPCWLSQAVAPRSMRTTPCIRRCRYLAHSLISQQ